MTSDQPALFGTPPVPAEPAVHSSREWVRQVACPDCVARENEMCIGPAGVRRQANHARRVYLRQDLDGAKLIRRDPVLEVEPS